MNCNYKVKITDIQTKYKFKVFCTGYDDSEIKEKIDAMYEAWPKASGEGETPTLDNTANATMSIDLKGNTSQSGEPTPDAPIPVNVVSGDNTIKVFGKNLYSRDNGEYNVPVYATDGTSASYQDVNVVWVKVKPNTDYSFTLLPNSKTYFVRIIECTGDKGFIYRFPNNYQPGSSVANTLTITTPNNCEWLQIAINQYETSQISQNNWEVMIEENATPSTYEPYQEQNYSVNLGSMELCKIGDYQDYIYKDNKKWYKYGAIGKVVLDGSENWWQDRELTNTYRYYTGQIIPSSVQNVAYSDNFKSVTTYTVNNTDTEALCRINEGQIAIRLNKTRATALAEFKTWLGTHNTVVYYALTTPEATEITDATLISQLEALKEAESYLGQTNISQVNNDKPFIITAKALKDLSNL